jgi:hypothetical protein
MGKCKKKKIVALDTPQMTIWFMRFACWISKATNTHSVHVIMIDFPVQHWLHKGATTLCYTYFSCLVTDEVASWQEFKAGKHLTYRVEQSCSAADNN